MVEWKTLLNWSDEQLEDLRNLGYAYIRQGKYDIALPFFEALHSLSKSAYDTSTLGAIFLELNQPSKAMFYFDQALKIDADHSITLINLAKALIMLGKKKEALKICTLLEEDKNETIARTAKALLLAHRKF